MMRRIWVSTSKGVDMKELNTDWLRFFRENDQAGVNDFWWGRMIP